MRKLTLIVIVLTLAAPALAGGGKCTAPPEECKVKLQHKLQQVGWLGIEMDQDDQHRTVITAVFPDSPAAAAGFQPGDVLLVMNGVPLDSKDKESMKTAKDKMEPGAKATYTVLRDGREVTLDAVLSTMPEAMAAKHIQKHMVEHHGAPKVAEK